MSAPSIPNLLSLRGSRGGGRRGRGRGGDGPPHSSTSSSSAAAAAGRDAVIQGTDTDAAVSRMSAVELGYLEDPFAQYFVPPPTVGQTTRRLPIINRGTYARTTALNHLISSFLSGGSSDSSSDKRGANGQEEQDVRQIVSLGAGTDTRVFRLLSSQNRRQPGPTIIYHEIDFPAVAAKKQQLVAAVPPLRDILLPPDATASGEGEREDEKDNDSGGTWGSRRPEPSGGGRGYEYWCHGLDLRDLLRPGPDSQDLPPPTLRGLRADVPTLLVSECCLCYLEAAQARGVLAYFAARIPDLAAVLYEPIRPDDAFGRQMVANLAARRLRLPTLGAYPDAAAQRARLRDAGFAEARALTVAEVWRGWVGEAERERVDGLEGLDEVEEWNLLAEHYVVAWGFSLLL